MTSPFIMLYHGRLILRSVLCTWRRKTAASPPRTPVSHQSSDAAKEPTRSAAAAARCYTLPAVAQLRCLQVAPRTNVEELSSRRLGRRGVSRVVE